MSTPHRIGILITPIKDKRLRCVLKYLILTQNKIQRSFEFSLLPDPDDSPFLDSLAASSPVSRTKIEEGASEFLAQYRAWLKSECSAYGLDSEDNLPVIVVSLAAFEDNYYLTGDDGWGIIALGNWKRFMAPPSIIEFFLVLILELSVDFGCGQRFPARHVTTRGCIFDFTADLADARYSILTGFICTDCRSTISEACSDQLVRDVELLLSKDWLGTSTEPSTVSINTRKLGYDLFHTTGTKPTAWESTAKLLREEGVKTLLKIIGTLSIAGLLLWLGLKGT